MNYHKRIVNTTHSYSNILLKSIRTHLAQLSYFNEKKKKILRTLALQLLRAYIMLLHTVTPFYTIDSEGTLM